MDLGDFGNILPDVTEMPTGLDSWANIDWSQFAPPSGPGNYYLPGGGEMQIPNIDWSQYQTPANQDMYQIPGGGGSGSGTNYQTWIDNIAKLGPVAGQGMNAIFGVLKNQQMAKYTTAVQDWYKKQGDYIAQKQAWEKDFMNQFQSAQDEFKGQTAEFEGQIAGAQEQAQGVLDQYMGTAKTLLGQSQELLVPAIAALAKGEEPESLKPMLAQARQRATATAVQSMVSAGMSPEQATANATGMVDQQMSAMLTQLASAMSGQGLAIGGQGMQGLQGAGQMAGILGQLAAAGFGPLAQEYGNMLAVAGHILGNTNMPPPPAPVA